MKKYRLKKELPDAKAGEVYTLKGDLYHPLKKDSPVLEQNSYFKWQVEDNDDWFEEIVEPERIEVITLRKVNQKYDLEKPDYTLCVSHAIPEDKFPALKQKIEEVLNGEEDKDILERIEEIKKNLVRQQRFDDAVVYRLVECFLKGEAPADDRYKIPDGWEYVGDERRYSASQLEEAEERAFRAAREKYPFSGSIPTKDKYLTYYDYKSHLINKDIK